MEPSQVSKLLKAEIQNRGLVMKYVAFKCGIPQHSFWAYLNGKRSIPESKLRCICLTIGIDLKIFGLDDNNNFQRKAI
jgi:hypothetical protein